MSQVFDEERLFLFNKHCWNSWMSIWKTWAMILTSYSLPKWALELNIKSQLVKLLEGNKTENLFDLGIGRIS